ncbi:dTDP-4-dehydrorhamnose reductase subunit, NAD(P)-binding, of dTDP-L-rhamnose synthase [Pseudomonas sp. 8AS]|uniref:dTDP-4-dehydrorhamnose reductase n=1 Tax=Pseudomonas sp. 8AS TaxID=2653163 RepID=UPI0012EF73A5|nr:dTDP-4-dehydrorhamnose reductase [Pseudomonas sp. 8AS]VXB84082.1 dTDP-4-dehydrorhamnose reductase subunit, NAD(P)-binding, of dTDP-L-rhamnose synthase [Pseudomonas sp. 8AS]
MRVLITGAHGQVGHELMRCAPAGFELVGLGSAELDIANAGQVAEVVARVQPQLIINAAAYTAVDKAESDAARAFAVNRDGVAHLACAAERLAIPLLHISTDYVFAGDAAKPYRESDPTGPTGVYGASKLAGEQALAEQCSRYLILRTSWVFGAHGNNFAKTMLRLGRERDSLAVVADQHGGPTAALAIAKMLWRLAERYRSNGTLPWGVYHYSGAPACSWHEFAEAIFQQALEQGLLPRVPSMQGITTADYPTPARRPAWSVLDGSRLLNTFGIEQPDWRADLREVLRELASVG